MNMSYGLTLQFAAWLLTLVEVILALYILVLNTRHTANRHVSALLFLFALNTFALGLMWGAPDPTPLAWYLTAATVTAIQPALFLVAITLLEPQWMRGRWRWIWWPIYALASLPVILTVVDWMLNTQFFYVALSPEAQIAGYVASVDLTTGFLSSVLVPLNIYVMGLATPIFLLYVILLDKKVTPATRRLAQLILGADIAVLIFQFVLADLFGPGMTGLFSALAFVSAYAYAGYQQMVSERRAQTGRLQTRLTALILVTVIPVLFGVSGYLAYRSNTLLVQNLSDQMEAANLGLGANASTWLDLNVQSLQQVVQLPDVVSMEAERQKPVLEEQAALFPYMYLVSTTDLDGVNVARSDDENPKDYSDRDWFRGARDGDPLTLQTLVGRTSSQPSLVASMPIRNEAGEIVGVGMFASTLADFAGQVAVGAVGDSGFAYIVDGQNQVVAHPESEVTSELRDLSEYPPVAAMRQGEEGMVRFTDENGEQFRAYVRELEAGWGVIVQLGEPEFAQDITEMSLAAGAVAIFGALGIFALTWLAIRQAIRPIDSLTSTAIAIAAGDLEQVAPVESEDEIGVLARAFNSMTGQLRSLIGSLEQQVSDRTRDLEQRTSYLEATADVGRAAASILEVDQLLQQAVNLVRERFGLYYVGLFLVDAAGEWAVLRAGTGEAGQAMLARDHRIQIGEGMIGWSVAQAQSRVALQAGEDALRLATPELPETRSEAALPLRSRGQVLGALTVQHVEPDAFDPNTMAVLQIMADQVAVALDNARLYTESQDALESARLAFGEVSREAWSELLRGRTNWGYRYARQRVAPIQDESRPEMRQAGSTGQVVQADATTGSRLAIPVKVRDEVVGVLGFRKGGAGRDWSPDEISLLEDFAEQLAVALESARLYEESRSRAAQEQLTSQITARMRETLDVETVLQTAVREIGEALQLHDLAIRLEVDGVQGEKDGSPSEREVL